MKCHQLYTASGVPYCHNQKRALVSRAAPQWRRGPGAVQRINGGRSRINGGHQPPAVEDGVLEALWDFVECEMRTELFAKRIIIGRGNPKPWRASGSKSQVVGEWKPVVHPWLVCTTEQNRCAEYIYKCHVHRSYTKYFGFASRHII